MKHALLYCQRSSANKIIAAYFFNARGGVLEKTPLGMFRSLLWQLLDQSSNLFTKFMPHVDDKRKKHGSDGQWPWTLGELRDFLFDVVDQGHIKPTYLFIDALDECEEREVREVVSFLEALSIAATRAGVSVNICLSSRHYPHIRMKKNIEIIVENEGDHDRDITTYVRDRLDVSDEAAQEQHFQKAIEKEIFRKADGVFMWVILVVELLNQAFDEGRITKVEEKLRDIPDDLDEVFRLILEKDNRHQSETVLMLQWVLFARRPLEPEELYFAVLSGTDPTALGPWNKAITPREIIKQYITNVSRGLIEIRKVEKKQEVQFIHETVNDFLLRNKRIVILDPSIGLDVNRNSHDRLAACCGTYLSMRSLQQDVPEEAYSSDIEDIVKNLFDNIWRGSRKYYHLQRTDHSGKYPFLQYSAQNILAHIKLATHEGVSRRRPLQQLLNANVFRVWSRSIGAKDGYNLPCTLALGGQTSLLRCLLLEPGVDITAPAGDYGSPFQAAAYMGHGDVVRLLLASGADVNANRDNYGTALNIAVSAGDSAIIRQLLGAGADVNAHGEGRETALQTAVNIGSSTIVCQLLDAGADVNACEKLHGTALWTAVFFRDPAIVRQLLDAGADVNALGRDNETALQAALSSWSTPMPIVIEMLLDAGASIDQYCLEEAAKFNDKSIMSMLQEELARRGTKVDRPNRIAD